MSESGFRFANSDIDPTGLDILDPNGARIAWGRGEYAGVALRAINRYISGDDPAARPRAAEGADDARIGKIQDADDLCGMLPDEILAEVRRLEQERDQARRDLAAAAVEHELLRRHLPAIVAYWDRYARAGFPISAEAVAFSDAVQAMRDLLAAPPATRGGAILEAADNLAEAVKRLASATHAPMDDYAAALLALWDAAKAYRQARGPAARGAGTEGE